MQPRAGLRHAGRMHTVMASPSLGTLPASHIMHRFSSPAPYAASCSRGAGAGKHVSCDILTCARVVWDRRPVRFSARQREPWGRTQSIRFGFLESWPASGSGFWPNCGAFAWLMFQFTFQVPKTYVLFSPRKCALRDIPGPAAGPETRGCTRPPRRTPARTSSPAS